MKKTLLIIDPQNDFCEVSEEKRPFGITSSLSVPGSKKDMDNIIKFIKENKLDEIVVTLDTHNIIDIAHPSWWLDKNGNHVLPFTLISSKDIEAGNFTTSDPNELDYSLQYVRKLEEQGKYQMIVWPEHCIQGSWGHNIYSDLQEELEKWMKTNNKNVIYFYKGQNVRTEHYSALKAEVVLDNETDLNDKLMTLLLESNELFICGEALSHCVASTVRDLLDNSTVDFHKKINLLKDCSSSVAGFESFGENFISEIKNKGVNIF